MVPAPAARQAARLAAGLALGIHLTLTAEYRGHRWRSLTAGRTLHDAQGFLPLTRSEALARLDPDEARAECAAQVETALGWGVDVTHLDVHMDVLFGRADLLAVYLDLAASFRLPVRLGEGQAEAARERGLLAVDRLVYPWPRPVAAVLAEEVPRLPPGSVTEAFAHPVEDSPAQRARDPRFWPLRAADAAALVDPALAALLERHGVRRIGYRALREAQRAARAHSQAANSGPSSTSVPS